MPHPFWLGLFSIVGFAAVVLIAVMAASISVDAHRMGQLHKAQLLTHIADEVAATVLANNPTLPLSNLSTMVVQQVIAVGGHDVTDARAIERAAMAALIRRGAKR